MPVAHAGGDRLKTAAKRRLPVGAEPLAGGKTHFRVWAPRCKTVSVVFDSDPLTSHPLLEEPGGYFANDLPATTGALLPVRTEQARKPPLRSGFALSAKRPKWPIGSYRSINL